MDLRARYAQQVAQRGFTDDPAQEAAIEALDALRSRLLTAPHQHASPMARWFGAIGKRNTSIAVRGVYLWGNVGRGKTWLMDLFYQSLSIAPRQRTHFHRFMHDVHAQLKALPRHAAPLEHVAEHIANHTRVLCFDELFVSDIADAMILGGLLGGLFRRGVTLVATSNQAPAGLYADGLQRQRFLPAIASIEQHLDVVEVGRGVDYRLRRLKQAGTYLLAAAPDSQARLEALFRELADGDGCVTEAGTIEIEGRPIRIVRSGGGIVWFDFLALCSSPRSQDDYIEIAREFRSVIVADVPVLDAFHDDEARRFIALVDELYDRNVSLIVRASAPPAQLYQGERLALAFQRTASRLIEMGSAEYLSRAHRS